MLIPNAIPVIPSNLILDVKQQRHNTSTVLSPKTTSQEEKGNSEPSEILTGVASVLFTMGMQLCAHPIRNAHCIGMTFPTCVTANSFWGITKCCSNSTCLTPQKSKPCRVTG